MKKFIYGLFISTCGFILFSICHITVIISSLDGNGYSIPPGRYISLLEDSASVGMFIISLILMTIGTVVTIKSIRNK